MMLRKVIETSSANLYVLVMSLASIVITARLLGPENRGIFIVGITWATVFALTASMSIDKTLMRSAAAYSGPARWVSYVFRPLIVIWLISSLAGIFGFLAFHHWLGDSVIRDVGSEYVPYLLGILLLTIWKQYQSALLLAESEIRTENLSLIIGSTMGTLFAALFVGVMGYGLHGAFMSVLLGAGTSVLVGLKWVIPKAKGMRRHPIGNTVAVLYGDGAKVHVNTLANLSRMHADTLMVNAFLGPAQAALLQIAVKLTETMLVVPYAVLKLFQGETVRRQPDGFWEDQKAYMKRTMYFMTGLSLLAVVLAPVLMPLVFGAAYSESVLYFQLLIPIVMGKSFGALMSNQIFARGYFKLASFIGLVVAVFNISLNAVLIPKYGIEGAIVATLVSFGVLPLILNGFFYAHYNRLQAAGNA